MTKIAVFRENAGVEGMRFRAVTVRNQAIGRTADEALDALASQLPEDGVDTLIIVRSLAPDRFFTAAQRERLADLWLDGKRLATMANRSRPMSNPPWRASSTPRFVVRPSVRPRCNTS